MNRLATACLVLAVAASARSAEGPTLDVRQHDLENGLRVLVHEDHSIPNVSLYVFWKVGSRNEVPGITGIAHFFEHMMFTGGEEYGAVFDPTMEAAGGSNNAWTSNDVTVYQDWFPAAQLPLMLDMEADRMRGMVFDPEVVESERNVVASERRLSMEEPGERLTEQLWAAAFTAHPYQWSVLGWMIDIQSWKKSDLEEFFATHYAPENATLVIAGAVDADSVFAMVEKRMGDIPRGPGRRPIHTQEPEQTGERRVTIEDDSGALPQVKCAWHIPATSDPEFAVHEVLERLLIASESSRLHQLLVEQTRTCVEVGGGWQGHQFDPSLFTIECLLREGGDTAAVEKLIYADLQRLAREGPTERELRAARNALRAAAVRRMKTIDGKAELIGETEIFFGGWRNVGARLDAIAAVTVEDVKRVIGLRFTQRNRTVGTLVSVEAK